jgi:hypothetical protein
VEKYIRCDYYPLQQRKYAVNCQNNVRAEC